jgi:hypothetical protein
VLEFGFIRNSTNEDERIFVLIVNKLVQIIHSCHEWGAPVLPQRTNGILSKIKKIRT